LAGSFGSGGFADNISQLILVSIDNGGGFQNVVVGDTDWMDWMDVHGFFCLATPAYRQAGMHTD
jgi:hypothetical protein